MDASAVRNLPGRFTSICLPYLRGVTMKFLVLGGAGFIGSHVCDVCLQCGHEVRLFDRFETTKNNVQHILPHIESICGDFGNETAIDQATRGVDVVVHLISTTLPKNSNDDMPFDISSNVIPTLHLLESCRKHGVRFVVYLSSGGTIYGIPETTPISESHPTQPICSYGIHKLTIEKYLHLNFQLHGMEYRVLRVANPYGERQRPDATQGVIAVFLGKAVRRQPIEIWGDGSVIRDYLHVEDVARAVEAATRYSPGRDDPRIFNIGGGRGMSLLEVVEGVERALGRKLALRFSKGRTLDVPTNVLDISRAATWLGWMPTVTFAVGLQRTLSAMPELP